MGESVLFNICLFHLGAMIAGMMYLDLKFRLYDPYVRTLLSKDVSVTEATIVLTFGYGLLLTDLLAFIMLAPVRVWRWPYRLTEEIMEAIGW